MIEFVRSSNVYNWDSYFCKGPRIWPPLIWSQFTVSFLRKQVPGKKKKSDVEKYCGISRGCFVNWNIRLESEQFKEEWKRISANLDLTEISVPDFQHICFVIIMSYSCKIICKVPPSQRHFQRKDGERATVWYHYKCKDNKRETFFCLYMFVGQDWK